MQTYFHILQKTTSGEPSEKQNFTESHRSVCAQLRSGTLPIAIETGRFNGLPEEEQLCLLCNLDESDNSPHDVLLLFIQYDDLLAILF